MEEHSLPSEPPEYSQSHDPQTLTFPQVPTEIHHERTLPPLAAALADSRFRQESEQLSWNQNPLSAYYQAGPSQLSPKAKTPPSPGHMDIDTPESGRRGGSVLSIDDPDVRLAAEALGDLRSDFIHSPPPIQNSHSSSSPRFQAGAQPEPLLSLLTTSHPLIGTAIGGSLSAYSASKNYSPRFKTSAEYVERGLTPVVNTVGSINRITGVESGVRWFLGGRRPSHHHPDDESGSNKRRKVGTDDGEMNRNIPMDPYSVYRNDWQHRQRRLSQASTTDSLPAYDEYRSPSYEVSQQALVATRSDEPSSPGSSWQSRLVLSTSGLSVAMSDESLRSLKYCLGWLRWANEHIGKVVLALKSLLEQYEHGEGSGAITNGTWRSSAENTGQLITHSEAERSALNARIAELKRDVLKTLKQVVDIVSKYAGGALPENARVLVRKHLTSLPQRFKLASAKSESRGEDTEGAKRVMVLAKEGLDMMAQVSGVLDGTIVSAEEWCERLGRKTREEEGVAAVEAGQDVKYPLA